MRWVLLVGIWAVAACGTASGKGPGDGVAGGAGSAGSSGSAGTSPVAPTCRATYAACACDGGLEGHEACNADDQLACDCSAPVNLEALKSCTEPCGGDVLGDWQLTDICAPQWAKGNCEHLVHDMSAVPAASGLTFGNTGRVTGNLSYTAKLMTGLTQVCANRKLGQSSSLDCPDLDRSLDGDFAVAFGASFKGNTCKLEGDACECETLLDVAATVDSAYATNASTQTLTLGGAAFEYCVSGETLSMRTNEAELSFNFARPKLSLPFEAIDLGAVENIPAPAVGLDLEASGCDPLVINTGTLEVSCGADRIRGMRWGTTQRNAFILRSLVVPEGTELRFEGTTAAVLVADTIDIRGTVTYLDAGAGSGGFPGTNQAAGGGGHCTAGGSGSFWTGGMARAGGPALGSFETLSSGGPGGSATYYYPNQANQIIPGAGGGGAIALLAATSISVSGIIDVSGGDGAATGPTPKYGAGGGAGGMIALEAPSVTVTATAKLLAGGGKGGGIGGGAGSISAASGTNGMAQEAGVQGGGGGGAGRILIKSNPGAGNVALPALTPMADACASIATF